jgi:tetratricopeptide (TPR) repeat protein
MTPRAASLVLLGGWLAFPWPSLHLPTWVERWTTNPRSSMDRAIHSYEAGRPKDGVGPADTALRLAPGDPLVQFDAGTVHLGAGDERQATELLENAAKAARRPELAATALYNLGNTRLAAKDSAGAIAAYKQALRLRPSHADAKYNLELALREQQKERKKPGGSKGASGQSQGQQGESKKPGADNPADPNDPRPSDANDPGKSKQSASGNQPGQQGQQGDQQQQPSPGQGGDPRLPHFRNQPDMNAREAASLLQAVENLERQQRQRQAARRAQQAGVKEKDW